MATDRTRSTGDESLPSVILDEFTHALPRLVHRTRHQVGAARHLVSRLPCLGVLAPPARPVATAPVVAAPPEPVPQESDLPVQDYDALAASQVVPRLATLSVDELDAVRRYERAHRNRQTILNRVAQLLDAAS